MGAQDHVTRPVNNAVSWIGSNIVKKEVNCLFSGNGSICLTSGNGTEGDQKFVVDRSGIVEKRADNDQPSALVNKLLGDSEININP